VQLYQHVDAKVDISVIVTDAVGLRRMKLWAMGDLFRLTPVPIDIDALCDKVKDKWGDTVNETLL
jgi:hypothetical protein